MRALLLAAFSLTLCVQCWAGIGTVSDTKGVSCAIERAKQKLSGEKGASIESMDTYVTGGCVSNITFKDDTKVKVTENSRLLIDDFVFDPKASDAGKLALKVGAGTVRYASGQIAKNNPQQVNIKTPTASVAVRGTDFTMTVDEAGGSLVVLLPSCKDEAEQKKYELEENKCKVGKISVSTMAGTVELDKAFEATFVNSSSMPPTPPVVVNTIESKINNNLILARPTEIQNAIKEQLKTAKDRELEDLEQEATRRMAQMVKQSAEALENARILAMQSMAAGSGCNFSSNICVIWDKPDAADIYSRGKGIAFRSNQDNYAEIKTTGADSNTSITIQHNDSIAFTTIGNADPGGNIVNIKQVSGVAKIR
jgi:hypothetical protein